MTQAVPAGYTVFPWASLPASFTLTAVSGGKWWAYVGANLNLNTTDPILNMFVDQPGDVYGGTGTTGWMRIQRVGTSGGSESVRHAGFDMFLNGWGGGNFDFAWRFYYLTGGNNAQVIIGNNYPADGVGMFVQDSGNGRVRINTNVPANATVFTISNLINGYGLYDGTYLTTSPFITSTDSAWHSVLVTRTANPGKSMTHIGHPDVSVSLANRSFYGYMSEVILFSPILTAQSSTVPDYNLFYKNAHVPFWQNGLIASYTPENWTGSSWVNGNFGTLPVTTLTGTTTKVASTNYQNIFTTLSSGAQTSARAMFSFRRVNTLYLGPNFRIRRSSDNFVQAFYADGAGNLGTAIGATGQPLLDWLGGSIAYVETWYDQSLNVRHATQTTWTLQPTLSLAKKCVDFTTNGTMFNLPSGTVPMNIPYTFVARHGYMSTSVSGGIIGAGGTNTTSQCNNLMVNASVGYYNYWFNNDANANLGGPSVPESVVSCRYDGPTTAGTTYFFVNGVQTSSTARSGWNGIPGGEMIGKTTNDSTLNGLLYDCFIFASALSDPDRTSIENVLMNSSSALPTLYGPSTATMTWPTAVLPSTYSIFHLAKYQKPSRGTYGRILQSSTTNWLSGFYNNGTIPVSGVAYHNGFLTQSVASAHGTNWVLSTDQNSLYRSLGRTRGTTGAGTPSYGTLAINTGFDVSDFTFQALMVYNRTLTAAEYLMVEDYLANRFKIPVPPQEGLALSLDASDYFTTDGTTWPDRSPNGRNFTLSATGAYVSTGAFPYMALSTNRATIATAVPSAAYNTLIVFGTIKNSTANWRGLIARDGSLMQVFIESGTNRLGMYNGTFIPCDQNVDVTTLDQVYTRFNMHVWKLSTVSPYYQYYFNPNVAPCRPTGVITDSRASYTAGFAFLSDSDNVAARYWGDMGTVLYYNRDLSDQELVEIYQRHMTKYLLPTPFVPMSPVPNGYVFTRSGMYTPGTGVTALKVLVIAGGGGGGGGWEGGGGGAGGLLFSGFYYVTAGVPIQVIIGQGGRGTRRNSLPENGGDTIFGTMRAIGGGSGAAEQNTASIGPASVVARSGGSGGGGSWGAPSGNFIFPPGAGTTGQGTSGGAGFGSPYIGGGGGGAATPGFDASYAYAGNGGDGRSWTMMGVTKTYCGGGGGSLRGSGYSSGGIGGGGGGNGSGTGANATYYGSGGGAGGGNGVACMGGDGFQGIVLVEVNVDPYPAPVLQNPGNQNFQAGGAFNINQTVTGIADVTWTITQVYNAANLSSPGNQTFTNGGVFTVTNSTNPYLTGALVWTISPTTGMTLVSNTTTSATFQCFPSPGISSVPYVVTATGPTGVAGSSPSFIVTNTSTYLYNFSTFTFTPMGATGRTGPTAITYGSSTPGFGTGSVMTLGSGTSTGMQLWVVPFTTNYRVTVAGARGGNGTQAGGNGAIVTVTLALTSGHVLRLLPGQIGTSASSGCGITKSGGGGGSFVYNNNTSTILVAAGGGGGGAGGPIITPGLRNASLTTSGNKGDGTTGGAGGASGNGGTGGSTACTSGGGGGGGWSGNGTNGVGTGNFGTSFINGGTGGVNGDEGTTNGGFGGAGAAGAHAGGGGGGYSGGGGGGLQTCSCGDTQVGGGGGSYATASFSSSSVTNTGDGYITISILNPNLPVVVNPGDKQLNTAAGNSFSVSQTTSTTLTGTITWTYSTLPSGMSVTSYTGSDITFGLAAGTLIAPQPFTVTATSANYPLDPSSTTFTLGASTSSIPGISQYYPATNAAQILAADPTVTNGVYWISCNGVSTQIYCIMNSLYDGGGWMLLMKGPQGSTFEYNSTYWTSSTTTLNVTDTNLNNNDAKFAAFNSVTVKDVMAWWPDVGITGGTIPSTPYWTWHINNWYSTDFPVMSADSTVISGQTYTASASSYWDSNYLPWRAFDYSTSTEWHTQQTATYNNGPYIGAFTTTVSGVSRAGEWLQLQYPSSVTITSYEIQARNGQNSTAPTAWWIAGSTNGSTWTLIDTRSGITWQTNLQTTTFTPATPGTYSYYRIIVNAVGAANYASMSAFNIRTTATSTRLTAFDGMSAGYSRNAPGASDPNTWAGNSTSIWSRQSGAWRHVIGGPGVVSGNQSVRWGFLYNNEAEFNSIDVSGGIGMGQTARSGGDVIGCCQSSTGLNRAMSFLFFGR